MLFLLLDVFQRLKPPLEDDVDDDDDDEGEGMEEKYNQVQNDWRDVEENEMDSASDNLAEPMANPFQGRRRRRRRRRRRSSFRRRRHRYRRRRRRYTYQATSQTPLEEH